MKSLCECCRKNVAKVKQIIEGVLEEWLLEESEGGDIIDLPKDASLGELEDLDIYPLLRREYRYKKVRLLCYACSRTSANHCDLEDELAYEHVEGTCDYNRVDEPADFTDIFGDGVNVKMPGHSSSPTPD